MPFILLAVLLITLPGPPVLAAAPLTAPGTAAAHQAAIMLPDTTTDPADTLEYPGEEQPYDSLEYAEEGEVFEEEGWNLFEFPAWIGLEFSGGFCATGNYQSMIGGAITYGKAMGDNGWVELSAGYTVTPLQQSSPLRETINENPGMFFVGVRARAFLSPADRPVRHHLLFGMGVDFLLWTYNTPINVAEAEGSVKYVSDDSLPGLDFHFGLGFTMFRESGMIVTAELVPGVKLWFDETRNGFTNDLFSSYGFVVLKLQAALQIGA
jgi:hypothetical protein